MMAVRRGPIVVTLLTAVVVMSSTLPGSVAAQGSPAPSLAPSARASTAPQPTPGASIAPIALPVRPAEDALAAAAASEVSDAPIPFGADVDLDAVAAAADAQVAAMNTARWSLRALADSFEGDPARAFAFVRDSIAYDVYPGVLRGAAGTLAARAGDAWDRAILLKTLLDAMSLTTRFATTELDATTAERVAARVLDPVPAPLEDGRAVAAGQVRLDDVGRRAARDYGSLRGALGERVDAMRALLPADLVDEARQHVWVQLRWGTGWLDYDPTMPDSTPGSSLASASATMTEVPDDLVHRVTVRLVAGTLSGSTIFEQDVLEQTFDAREVADRQVFLYFQPELSGIGGGIVRVLSGVETWTPVLLVDGEATMGRPFEAGGRGTDVFGDPTTTSPLVSLRLEITRSVPGRPDEAATHVLLDRVPPALADSDTITEGDLAPLASDDAGPLVMGILTQVLVSTGGASGWMQAARRSIAADFMDLLVSDESSVGEHALGDLLYPLAVANASLVLASEQLAIPALDIPGRVRGYVAAPRVWLMTTGQDPTTATDMGSGTDLLIDDVRVVGADEAAAADGALAAIWYGTLESAFETELVLGRAGALSESAGQQASTSLAMGQPLAVLAEPGDATGGAPALQADLGTGVLAVVPGEATRALAWWTVDPATGATRAVLDPGTGGGYGRIAWGAIANRPPVRHLGGGGGANTHWLHPDGSIRRYPPGSRPPGGAPQGPPPSRCGGGQEYVTILGCVSIPAAWTIRIGLSLVVTAVVIDAIIVLASHL